MATVKYDRYGRQAGQIDPLEGIPEPYLVDRVSAALTYICYYNTNPRAVRRITVVDTLTTVEVAYGDWDNRENLTYYPVNHVFEVTT